MPEQGEIIEPQQVIFGRVIIPFSHLRIQIYINSPQEMTEHQQATLEKAITRFKSLPITISNKLSQQTI